MSALHRVVNMYESMISLVEICRICIKPGIQERGTECRERGEWRECYIPENVAKYSGEYRQTFRGM